jgi:predicted dehydrogenase
VSTISPLRVALVGYGYWGPNVARNVAQSEEADLAAVVDLSPSRRVVAASQFPKAKICESVAQLEFGAIDAVVIATPASSHVELAAPFLAAGVHVLIEKPLALSMKDAVKLVQLAKTNNCVLMVDHTYLFSDAVIMMAELVRSGQLGDLIHFDSTRVNLGIFQPDTSVIWDLAVHDVAILRYVTGLLPKTVSATTHSHRESKHPVVASMSLQFSEDFFAHIAVSWISPVKVRKLTLSGFNKTIVFDDVASDEKIRVYDSGVDSILMSEGRNALLRYRLGDVIAPRLRGVEALRREIDCFVSSIRSAIEPISSGADSLATIAVLQAAEKSALAGGEPVKVDYTI